MGNSKPQTITQTVPEEAKPFLYGEKGILNRAQAISEQPLNLPDYQVAGFSPAQRQAFNRAQSGIGGYMPALSQAAQATKGGIGSVGQAMKLVPQALSGARSQFAGAQQGINEAVSGAQPFRGLSTAFATSSTGRYDPLFYLDYMNPYTEGVIRQSELDIARQGDIQGQQIRSQAVGAGAFGGSRQAVAERELGRNVAEQQARTSAALRAQGFEQSQAQAQQAFEQQQQRALTTSQILGNLGTSYGQLGLQGASQLSNLGLATGQLGLQGASQLGALGQGLGALGGQMAGLGELGQQLNLRDVGTLMDIGTAQQAQTQAGLDALRQNQYQRTMAPYQQLGFFSDIYQGMPVGQMTTQPGPNALSQIAGLGMGIYGLTRPRA